MTQNIATLKTCDVCNKQAIIVDCNEQYEAICLTCAKKMFSKDAYAQAHYARIAEKYNLDLSKNTQSTTTHENARAYDQKKTYCAVTRLISEFDCYLELNNDVDASNEHTLFYTQLKALDMLDTYASYSTKEKSEFDAALLETRINDVCYLLDASSILIDRKIDEYITRKCLDLRVELACYRDMLKVLLFEKQLSSLSVSFTINTTESNEFYDTQDTRIALMKLSNTVNMYACLMTANTSTSLELQSRLFDLRDMYSSVSLLKESEIDENTSVKTLFSALDVVREIRESYAELRKLENVEIDTAINALKTEITRYKKALDLAMKA